MRRRNRQERCYVSISSSCRSRYCCLQEKETVIIRKNIRSGQKIEYDGTLVILGDVNAGAELVATGHILVLGTLRGLAHAGSDNNLNAVVYAQNLLPLQLRIGDLIARAPEDELAENKGPEIARVVDEKIIIDDWTFWNSGRMPK